MMIMMRERERDEEVVVTPLQVFDMHALHREESITESNESCLSHVFGLLA